MNVKAKKFPWVFTGLWLIILLVMLSAGYWQISRAEEKRQINLTMAAGEVNLPQTSEDWQALAAFDRVEVSGQYTNTHFLLDNQIMTGQVGFFVFTAFRLENGNLMLVNRGWSDDDEKSFDIAPHDLKISALVADWPRPGIQLGEQTFKNLSIQHLTYLEQEPTLSLLKQRLCESNTTQDCVILPQVLKLDSVQPHGFKRQWQLPRMTVEKHQGYAAQWFTMSLVLCLIYWVFIKKIYASKN